MQSLRLGGCKWVGGFAWPSLCPTADDTERAMGCLFADKNDIYIINTIIYRAKHSSAVS